MNRRMLLLLLATGLLLTGCMKQDRAADVPPPPIPANAVFRPAFALKDGRDFAAGTAFAATVEGAPGPLLVTALHLFGEAGGLPKQIPAEQVPAMVLGALLTNMDGSKMLGVAAKGLTLRGAYPHTNGDCSGDVAAFALKANAVTPLSLAPADPPKGTPVWVLGRAADDPGAAPVLYGGIVVSVSPRSLEVRMDMKHDQTAMSGAPVINGQGQVVGMLIGGGELLGNNITFCNPVSSLRSRLAAAIARK